MRAIILKFCPCGVQKKKRMTVSTFHYFIDESFCETTRRIFVLFSLISFAFHETASTMYVLKLIHNESFQNIAYGKKHFIY